MSIYVMRSISDRKQLQSFLNVFTKHKVMTTTISLAYGTAVSEMLGRLGLEASEKAITTSFVTMDTWKQIRREEESVLQNTKYELLTIVSNIGYSNMVMDAARAAGAGGGTIVHARGTGVEGSERFFGVQLASEKEMIYIVVRSSEKNRIMEAIIEQAGMHTRAKAIVFSLPVTEVAGMRLVEMNEEAAQEEAAVQ